MTRVVFFGNERLVSGLERTSAPILTGLIERGYEVVAIISHNSTTLSRNNRTLEVAEIARAHDIPLYLPNKPTEIIEQIRAMNADIAVLAAYGKIISQQIINIFPLGIINIHPSVLPKYRGPTPIESAILNGDDITGVSIMKLTSGMDEGPIYGQKTLPISNDEDKFDLYTRIARTSETLFFGLFQSIIDGSIQPEPQSNQGVTYCNLIDKKDGIIDWNKPAIDIVNEIRAYKAWPQSRTKLGSIDVIITNARSIISDKNLSPGAIDTSEDDSLIIGTGNGFVSIDSIKPLGKKEMPVKAFLAGYNSKIRN